MKQETAPKLALSIVEAATALSVSAKTIHRLIRRNRIHSVKIGKRRVVPVAELERLLSEGARPSSTG
jgi:excisionase family DNA binding protein